MRYDRNRMTMIRLIAVLSALAGLVAAAATPAPSRVTVERREPEVTRKTFDPRKPPATMPAIKRGEEAVAVDWFSIEVDMDVDNLRDLRKPDGTYATGGRVKSMRIKTGLTVTIWVPERASASLKEHEEGHRRISEHFYGDAESAAREVGRAWVGRSIDGAGKDAQAATQAAIDGAIRRMADEYLAKTQTRAQRVHELYDEITQHGRDRRVTVDEGIRRALEREKAKD